MIIVFDHVMNYNTFLFNLIVQTPAYFTLIALYYIQMSSKFKDPITGLKPETQAERNEILASQLYTMLFFMLAVLLSVYMRQLDLA